MATIRKRNRPTLQDIARAAGVSVATVSYVLNNTGSVSPDVRKKVRAVARDAGYRVNHVARATRTGQTLSMGIILPDLTNPFFPQLAQAVQHAAHRAGYAVYLIDSEGEPKNEHDAVEDLLKRGVEGIVWCPATERDILAEFREEIPIVVVDRPLPNYDTVSSDYEAGSGLLADDLVARGHSRIGMVVGPQMLSSAKLRRDGFVKRIGDRARIDWEVENPFTITLTDETRAAIGASEASVVVCGNDFIAIGVMRALHDLGKHVPEDVSVVGFDDVPWAGYSVPGLATLRQPITAIGKEAAELLIRRIGGDAGPPVSLALGMELVSRESLQ